MHAARFLHTKSSGALPSIACQLTERCPRIASLPARCAGERLLDSGERQSRKEAKETLTQRLAAVGTPPGFRRSRVPYKTIAEQWRTSVVPMYKHTTQKNHRHILEKHLLPWFGEKPIVDVTRQEVQAYVSNLAQREYAPKTFDHIHDVLSAVLRTSVKWGHLQENPARDIDLPALRTIRPKWALTIAEASALLDALPHMPADHGGARAVVRTAPRRTVCAALERSRRPTLVREAVYDGKFDTPKTEAGLRQIPLSETSSCTDHTLA